MLERFEVELRETLASQRRHDSLGVLWQNLPIRGSYAAAQGVTEIDPEVKKHKMVLRKSWPELADILDEIADNTPRR